MEKKDFRTYHRRPVTRRSGFKVTGNKTGGECIILPSTKYKCTDKCENFLFYKKTIDLVPLFEQEVGILAFGGYLYSLEKFDITLKFKFSIEGIKREFEYKKKITKALNNGTWNPIGFHKEISLDVLGDNNRINDVYVEMIIHSESKDNVLQFIGFELNAITYSGYQEASLAELFKKKTSMHIPQIYYFKTNKKFSSYLVSHQLDSLEQGEDVVLKSCNRCDRYLPININDEINTLSFSLHCKKKAPCKHSLFSKYKIDNINDLEQSSLNNSFVEDGHVKSYYGHQLECTACKKYYVNGALNKLRNSQQFREDSLRRRALEVLVDNLLGRNIVHFEFREAKGKEFSEYIWEKFNRRCFKCGEKLALDEMHLDHTMPLAYLYRLDETATCLCAECNSKKRDHFPVEFYSEDELIKLMEITGLDEDIIRSRKANPVVVDLLVKNVVWFFHEFLGDPEYQKVRDGVLTSDKIYASIVRVLDGEVDLVEEYYKEIEKFPPNISKLCDCNHC
ncbi:HNH endonuclease [Bacillus smithii]|uniref:HNH endonuclease n=1 Tax=Bacillus smithii TaxID=1479 RepID=UPI003D2441E8